MKPSETLFDTALFSTLYRSCDRIPAPWCTDEHVRRATVLAEHLTEDNARFNLTAIRDTAGIFEKHILDSLFCAEAVRAVHPDAGTLLDVGSGAGFPSLPIALALPEIAVTALDATAKKVTHMEESARRAGLTNFRAVAGRAEELAQGGMRASFDVATARAVAALPILIELCLPMLRQGGYLLAMKGESAPAEVDASKNALHLVGGEVTDVREYRIPSDPSPRYIVVIRKKRDTPRVYPRVYTQIAKKPL